MTNVHPNSKANLIPDASGRARTWVKGMPSPNPGGRVSIIKALEDRGLDARSLTAEIVGHLIDGMRELDKSDPSWRFCAEQLLNRLMGKPKETVDLNVGGASPEQEALLEAIRMTPHERRLAAAKAPDDAAP